MAVSIQIKDAINICVLSSLIKCLTLNAKLYYSTDFEVHRNWLALTHSLPFSEWYKDSRNMWTLDYPPFFAYFELMLSWIAKLFDPEMLNPDQVNYASFPTIVFQRLSVILISDGFLALGTYMILPPGQRTKGLLLALFSSSLFIVDHIHFQYNGMLIGILLMSAYLVQRGSFYSGAIVYMILIFMKHIFLFCAPVYLIYFFRHFVLASRTTLRDQLTRLVMLVSVIAAVASAAVYPLIHTNQFFAALQRMFPFGRGLTHSYWAPNCWAIYSFIDRLSGVVAGIKASPGTSSSTSGIVGVTEMLILPNITPTVTFAATFICFCPLMRSIWRDKKRDTPFITWVGLGCAVAFALGWHIHEKGILMILLPILIGKLLRNGDASAEWKLSVVACASLFPLLPRSDETPLKWLLFLSGLLLESLVLEIDIPSHNRTLLLAVLPEMFRVSLHPILFGNSRLEFLPLMLNSVVSALLILHILYQIYIDTLQRNLKAE